MINSDSMAWKEISKGVYTYEGKSSRSGEARQGAVQLPKSTLLDLDSSTLTLPQHGEYDKLMRDMMATKANIFVFRNGELNAPILSTKDEKMKFKGSDSIRRYLREAAWWEIESSEAPEVFERNERGEYLTQYWFVKDLMDAAPVMTDRMLKQFVSAQDADVKVVFWNFLETEKQSDEVIGLFEKHGIISRAGSDREVYALTENGKEMLYVYLGIAEEVMKADMFERDRPSPELLDRITNALGEAMKDLPDPLAIATESKKRFRNMPGTEDQEA